MTALGISTGTTVSSICRLDAFTTRPPYDLAAAPAFPARCTAHQARPRAFGRAVHVPIDSSRPAVGRRSSCQSSRCGLLEYSPSDQAAPAGLRTDTRTSRSIDGRARLAEVGSLSYAEF